MAWFGLVLTVWMIVSVPIALLVAGAIKVGAPSGDEDIRFARDGFPIVRRDLAEKDVNKKRAA